MSIMAIQSRVINCSTLPYQRPNFKSFKSCFFLNLIPKSILFGPISTNQRRSLFASPEALTANTPTIVDENEEAEEEREDVADELIPDEEIKKVEVPVKQIEKPRLVLKFMWMEKNIGLGVDQVIPGHGSVPLSPYYFWPRKDAWEELKTALESKPWISQKKMVILLNQATDIINLWQQSGGNLTA